VEEMKKWSIKYKNVKIQIALATGKSWWTEDMDIRYVRAHNKNRYFP
jgi:hypothetical protein